MNFKLGEYVYAGASFELKIRGGWSRDAEGVEAARNRGAEGGVVWGGVSPYPVGVGSREGAVPPPQKIL